MFATTVETILSFGGLSLAGYGRADAVNDVVQRGKLGEAEARRQAWPYLLYGRLRAGKTRFVPYEERVCSKCNVEEHMASNVK